MDVQEIITRNAKLSVKEKNTIILNLTDKLFKKFKEKKIDSEMIGGFSNAIGYVAASMFLVSNTPITNDEYAVYKLLNQKYATDVKTIDIENFKLIKQGHIELLNKTSSIADTTISAMLKFGAGIDGIIDLIVELLFTIAGIDNVVDSEELEHISNLINIDDHAVTVKGGNSGGFSGSTGSQPLFVKEMGGTLKRDDSNLYFSVGAEIRNPNKNLLAKDVVVKVIGTSSSGSVVLSENETIYNIDANSSFYFGKTYYCSNGAPSSYKILVDAESFEEVEVGTLIFDGISFSNFSMNKDRWNGVTLTGNFKSIYNKRLSYVDTFLVFYDDKNEIVGGIEFYLNDVFSNSEDAFSERVDADMSRVKNIKSSITFR